MRLILDPVTIDHHDVRLEGPLVVLEKLSQTGASKSLPEVLSFAREWRAREDSNLRPPDEKKSAPAATAGWSS